METQKSKIVSLASALLLMILPWPHFAEAQQPTKIPRIGFLTQRVGIEAREEAFRKGLRELGYIEGQNIIIEWRFTEGKRERQADLAADLVRLKVDCIVTAGTSATHAAWQATSTIPIVMGSVGDDPVQQGLVASLARPGGNITGFTIMGADLAGNGWSCSKRPFQKSPVLPSFGIRPIQASRPISERPRSLPVRSACSFKAWNFEVPRTLKLHSERQ
jgi:hypothetical protein